MKLYRICTENRQSVLVQVSEVEAKIRTYANCFSCSTFLAQWLIWDHVRGGEMNAHAIFPGSHKG